MAEEDTEMLSSSSLTLGQALAFALALAISLALGLAFSDFLCSEVFSGSGFYAVTSSGLLSWICKFYFGL